MTKAFAVGFFILVGFILGNLHGESAGYFRGKYAYCGDPLTYGRFESDGPTCLDVYQRGWKLVGIRQCDDQPLKNFEVSGMNFNLDDGPTEEIAKPGWKELPHP